MNHSKDSKGATIRLLKIQPKVQRGSCFSINNKGKSFKEEWSIHQMNQPISLEEQVSNRPDRRKEKYRWTNNRKKKYKVAISQRKDLRIY